MKETRQLAASRVLTVLIALIFLAYLAALVKITLVKGTTFPRLFQNLLAGRAPLRAVNLIPFQTFSDYLGYRETMPFLRWFSNIFGNMLVFVPMGLYLPTVFPKMRRYLKTLLAVVLVSACLEGLQYLLGTGSTDIDDLWLNAVGGSLGYLLFSLVSRFTAARVTALTWALALSGCFAVAGYVTAYREFGMYLGLATLREEVQGDRQIPRRAADAMGTVDGVRDNSLILADAVRPRGATDAKGGTGTPAEPAEVVVQVTAQTRFYDRQVSLEGHTETTRYVPYAPRTLADVPKDARAHVWGRWQDDRLVADVVWTMRASEVKGTTTVVTTVNAPGGLTLPKSRPALEGYTGRTSSGGEPFKGVIGNEVVVHKITRIEKGSSIMAFGSGTEARFRLSPRTVFYKQRIRKGGRDVYLSGGSRDDIIAGRIIRVWGEMRDGTLVADVVCVVQVERR